MRIIASNDDREKEKKLNFFQVFFSVAAAFFGVQTPEKRERDFKQGNIWHFVATGLLMTFLFMASLMLIVNQVLKDL